MRCLEDSGTEFPLLPPKRTPRRVSVTFELPAVVKIPGIAVFFKKKHLK